MDRSPIERLTIYQPVILIMGVRKTGQLESVLCVDKKSVTETLDLFNEVRVFSLKEEDPKLFIKKVTQ